MNMNGCVHGHDYATLLKGRKCPKRPDVTISEKCEGFREDCTYYEKPMPFSEKYGVSGGLGTGSDYIGGFWNNP